MTVPEAALRLEALLPQVIMTLFSSGEFDPLRHHTVGQARLMRILMEGSKTASELSHTLGLSPSSLTQMAARMIQAGLVMKELDPHDRRVRRLSLTQCGKELMASRQAVRARAAATILDQMDPERLQAFFELLDEILTLRSERGMAFVEATV